MGFIKARSRYLTIFSLGILLFLIATPSANALVLGSQTDFSGSTYTAETGSLYEIGAFTIPTDWKYLGTSTDLYLHVKLGVTNGTYGWGNYVKICKGITCSGSGSERVDTLYYNSDESGMPQCNPSNLAKDSTITDLNCFSFGQDPYTSAFVADPNTANFTASTTYYLMDVSNSDYPFSYSEYQLGSGGTPYFVISDSASPPDTSFYSSIDTPSGYGTLYSAASATSTALKQLPNDWVLSISTTTDSFGNPVLAGGYDWYQATDPTDGVSGWMEGVNATSTMEYLPYDASEQVGFASTSSDYVATSSRPDIILAALNDYYTATSTVPGIYNANPDIESLVTGGFPEEVIPGIITEETYGSPWYNPTYDVRFNNEFVQTDYGSGIMQITPYDVWAHEATDDWADNSGDNRGEASKIKIYPCTSDDSNLYTNCYTYAGSHDSTNQKSYQPYGEVTGQPEYKYYTNTIQSIYANIKDGLEILSQKFANMTYNTGVTIDGTYYSANDRNVIGATESYYFGHFDGTDCGYAGEVGTNLASITTPFPDATTTAITDLIPKLEASASSTVCAQIYSPAELSISDDNGDTVGVVHGQGMNNFPLATYDPKDKSAAVLFANDDYRFRVAATGAGGDYGLNIVLKNGAQILKFTARGIPIAPNEVHTYKINKQKLLNNEDDAVTIEIDSHGDGTIDKTIQVGLTLNAQSYAAAIDALDTIVTASTTATSTDDTIAQQNTASSSQNESTSSLPTLSTSTDASTTLTTTAVSLLQQTIASSTPEESASMLSINT